ncbi:MULTISPECIES: hypothetical protein [Gluconobacter]|uniref:hypothetical protein n=1 Tax=Gluconobacter TaxID=441 RepID=UPI001F212CA9|nr:hypothetical protein [Gluconobacter cadivus]
MRRMNALSSCGPFLALLGVLYFGLKAFYGFGTPSFGDESGHILGGLAIAKGDVLYRDYIDAHGPLIFILSWSVSLFSDFHHAYLMRLVPIVCTIGTSVSVFCSPALQKNSTRFLAIGMWLAAMGAQWSVQAFNMDSYWTVGGDLLGGVIALVILPLLLGADIGRWQARCGGACLALLPLTAYSFAPTAVLLALSVLIGRRPGSGSATPNLLAGAGGVLAVCLVWMVFYGDLGGMIAYHFVANQFYYAPYIDVGLRALAQSLIPSLRPDALVQSLATICFYGGSVLLLVASRQRLAVLLLLGAILMTQVRGALGFQDGTFAIGALTLCVLMLMRMTQPREIVAILVAGLFCTLSVLGLRQATSSPYDMSRAQQRQAGFHPIHENADVGFVKVIQKYSEPQERILVIPYNPDVYIYAGRLSMKKYHEYLPWEADYARHPWFGYERDLCVDLPANLPPVIYFDDYRVWGRWSAADYMPCVLKILARDYQRDPVEKSVYIRRDRLDRDTTKAGNPALEPQNTH